ncbi:sugar-phosphate nucleotidyltransferase [Mycoplasma sp. 3686d]|uniref:sugar-phosphate nucleotidyltransferase n=1 Tax=Mycoplasma sp. 3686d TaxID=2967300 RepID=UPI00211C2F2F|nr:sugar-phosphate nucleotidyltransferase [Mycoplasma sp. 3686d]UUM24538.1 sugar-phosphate nucleotidyltransferase [Mycoplasma sp. 3686d]
MIKKTYRKDDEFYTPRKWVEHIIDHLENTNTLTKDMVIWCPFDLVESNFPSVLRERGYKVINSHINTGQDFYTYTPREHYDIIISNPPFAGKTQLLERLISLGEDVKWALIFPNHFFLTQGFMRQLNNLNNLQFISFEKRMYFIKDYALDGIKPKTQPLYQSLVLTNNLYLPKFFTVLRGV